MASSVSLGSSPPIAPELGTDADTRLPTRLAWITGARLGLLTLLLVTIAFFYLRGAIGGYPKSQGIVFATIGTAYALAAVYATVLRSGRRLLRLAEAQIVLDQLTWTAIVYVSGGATSGATSFYGLTCLVGAILIGPRGAALAAVSGYSIFLGLCAAFAFGWIHPPLDQGAANYIVDWPNMVYPLAINALGIVVVSLLAGYLADRLRRAGGAIREANERALAAERLAMLGKIAAGLAHEIRNPLGSISGSIEMLRDAPGLSDEDKRLCDIVHGEAARLNNLVSDMMDLARPKQPEPEDVDVAALARDVVELASRSERSGAGDVAVVYRGPEGAVLARCDPGQMRQVVWNLVRNAVQASPAGTSVIVEVEADSKRVQMSVSDEGPGVSEEAAAKIFDAFYTTRSQGAGIGLAVVRRIIDDHASVGATIEVRDRTPREDEKSSRPKHGATFVIGLERSRSPSRATVPPDPAITPPANARSRPA